MFSNPGVMVVPLYSHYLFLLGEDKVYDVTKYLSDHPGGPEIMLEFAGERYLVLRCCCIIFYNFTILIETLILNDIA